MVKICRTDNRGKRHTKKNEKTTKTNTIKANRKSPRLNKLIICENCNFVTNTITTVQASGVSIQQLPNEILLNIFKYLSPKDLWHSVRLVCRQWEDISKCHYLWEQIEADGDIPTNVLQEWLRIASSLKSLKLKNRKDADLIIEQASRHNQQLVSIEARDCWGSNFRRNVKSKPLCNLLRRCPMLSNINFGGTRFISCQFYKLMAKHNTMHSVVKRNHKSNKPNKVHPINYCGGANGRQIRAFLLARKDAKTDYLAHLLFESMGERHSWRLADDYEVIENVQDRVSLQGIPVLVRQNPPAGVDGLVIPPDQVQIQQQDGNQVDMEVRVDDIDVILEYIGLL